MAELPIPTVLSLSAVSAPPSVKCVQFSQDGQAILLTKYAVYILTPDTGISVELSSVIKQAPDSSKLPSRSTRPLGWLRTMVEFDRSLAHQWPNDCKEWSAVSLGSLDPSLHAVTLSPSNLTADAGCGLPHMLQDVTSALKTAWAAKNPPSAVEKVLRNQSTCIAWSPQPQWGREPAPLVDASLLAVGNRLGSVTFLRYDKAEKRMAVVAETHVADRWVTHLAWSAWTIPQDGTCEAMLACGTADGSIVILTVRQTLDPKPTLTNISSDHALSLSIQVDDEKKSESDGKAITGLQWANTPGRSTILIYHKPGVVHLWSAPSSEASEAAWSGSRAFVLRTQTRSVGSSALSPASGISYISSLDMAVVSLSDGSFYIIHKLSIDPTSDPPLPGPIQPDTLPAVSRSVFVRAEPEKVSFKDVDRIHGAVTYDGGPTFMWTYEASRPTDFSYKHDAKHICTFVVAQLWDEDLDDRVLGELAERVGHVGSVSGEAPISMLRPLFLHLRDPSRVARLHSRILEVLYRQPFNGADANIVVPVYAGDWTLELCCELRRSLTTQLFGWSSIQSQRMRYAVALFCQNHAETADIQQKFADAANLFLASIRAHVHLVLIRHLSAISGVLSHSVHDIFFARRTIHQATTAGAGPVLAKEAEKLLAQLPPAPHSGSAGVQISAASPAVEINHVQGEVRLDEQCPACSGAVPLQSMDGDSAVCTNGHVWARCCVTSFLLATPMVRTCIGCGRKALLPPSAPARAAPEPSSSGDANGSLDYPDARVGDPQAPPMLYPPGGIDGLPNAARFVQDLLDATRRCPFCGNNFVVLV
ncbi:putative zinc-finger of transcription factor IIIC complex-domain-containing protein [Cerioporus squamosus]|nr:putative zinc-finger of transcription factor IIIC complex-domain-containing protein [Cerioporus squamosus]